MSSPILKLSNFSRIFSPTLPVSPKSFTLQQTPQSVSPALVSTSALLTSSAKIPAASSTPKRALSGQKRSVNACSDLQYSEPSFATTPLYSFSVEPVPSTEAAFNRRPVNFMSSVKPGKYLSLATRKRHFGVSDAPIHNKTKSHSARHCNKFANYKINKSDQKKCCAFSARMTPASIPKVDKVARVLRLTGVALSPSSVSWSSQSPVWAAHGLRHASKTNMDPSAYFLWHDFDFGSISGEKITRLQETYEQCPLGKFYFWEEDLSELVTNEPLGRGGFGRVFEGIYRGEKVAIKQLENSFKSRQAVIDTLQGEMNGLRLNHPNIVRTFVIIQANPSPQAAVGRNICYVVMEHAGNRNLSQLINDSNETIPPSRRYKFSMDILSALAYLHSKSLAHLDLKPSNVVVTTNDRCKLCDFGSCIYVNAGMDHSIEKNTCNCNCNINVASTSDSMTSSSAMSSARTSSKCSAESTKSSYVKFFFHAERRLLGTFIYRAPELLRGYAPCSKSDMFSFSVTAWQLWSRELPYSGQHNHTVVFAVVAFGARPKLPSIGSSSTSSAISSKEEKAEKEFFDLIASSWNAESDQRPTAEKAIATIRLCQILLLETERH